MSDSINQKSTPPTNRKIRNPFDKALISRLHTHICSPGMCRIYKKQSNGTFRWDIDQACALAPAEIIACNSQFEPSPDPFLEKIADEATEKFFSQEMVVPSPLENTKKTKLLQTSHHTSIEIDTVTEEQFIFKDVAAQTILTLPPILPPEVEIVLQQYCTFTQDQNVYGENDISANGLLRRKLLFDEHNKIDHSESEHTDDETQLEKRPPPRYKQHSPVIFSPEVSHDVLTKGMKRTFGTPINKFSTQCAKATYRNKILDGVDPTEPCFSPIIYRGTPGSVYDSATPFSLPSTSISPVTKTTSSDDEKNNFTSPESDMIAKCLDCESHNNASNKWPCFCKSTPDKSSLKRSASLKDPLPRNRKSLSSLADKRSASMSSLHRSRSVQKLDFSMDMSIDGSFTNHMHEDSLRCQSELVGSDFSMSPDKEKNSWDVQSNVKIQYPKDENLPKLNKTDIDTFIEQNKIDETPIKVKVRSNKTHGISQIRAAVIQSPGNMSLDNSFEYNILHLEDKKVEFNKVDLQFLTPHSPRVNNSDEIKKNSGDSTISFKRVDSGFNENSTFYGNASSYYESSIKPSELTLTEGKQKEAVKEISNLKWKRFDSGFKDENSGDSVQFYPNEGTAKSFNRFNFAEAIAKMDDKENIFLKDFDKSPVHLSNSDRRMSMSDVFCDDIAFSCNFSSTPSKHKTHSDH